MSEPVIKFEYGPSGKCPVQAEGRINGYPFYFKARGAHWTLYVGTFLDDPVDFCAWTCADEAMWYHREEYKGVMAFTDEDANDGNKFAAGWAMNEECVEFITRAAGLWAKAMEANA